MSSRTTRETVDAFFAAFGAGDLHAVKSLFAPSFSFTVHGSPAVPWTGIRHHPDDLDEFFAAFAALGQAEEYTILHILTEDENAVALGRNRFPVLVTGKTFTNDFALHFTVQNGLITGYQMYENSYAVHHAFVMDN